MAITFTGSSGSGAFFMRVGRLFKLAKFHNSFRDDVLAEIDDVNDEFTTADSDQISGLVANRDSFAKGSADIDRSISSTLQKIVIETVRDGLGLQPNSFDHALTLLIKDMRRQGVYVSENTIGGPTLSAGLDGGSNTANIGTVLTNEIAPDWMTGGSGNKKYQHIRAETMRIECVADESYGNIAGAERFHVTGAEAYDRRSPQWPAGSNADMAVTVTSAALDSQSSQNNVTKNLLRNSTFDEAPTATTFTGWTLGGTGTALSSDDGGEGGSLTDNQQRTSTRFGDRGSYNIQFNGNGSYKHSAFQRLGNTQGSKSRVYSGQCYVVSCQLRAHTTTITSGVLRAALWNGTSSRLSGASATIDFSSTNISTSYTNFTASFVLSEKVVPQDVRFALDFSTALQDGRSLIVGELILAQPVQLYPGGPKILITRGAADYRLRDGFTLAYTNNYNAEMQTFFDQYANMGNMLLPVVGSTAVSDGTYIA